MRRRSATIEANDVEEYIQKSKEAFLEAETPKKRSPPTKNRHHPLKQMNTSTHIHCIAKSMPLPDILEADLDKELDVECLMSNFEKLMTSKEIVSSLGYLDEDPVALVKVRKESSLTSFDELAGSQSIGEYTINVLV